MSVESRIQATRRFLDEECNSVIGSIGDAQESHLHAAKGAVSSCKGVNMLMIRDRFFKLRNE